MDIPLFIHLSISRYLFLEFGAIPNKAIMTLHAQLFVWTFTFISLELMSRNKMAGSHMVGVRSTFKETTKPFSKVVYHFTFPQGVYESPSSFTFTSTLVWLIF